MMLPIFSFKPMSNNTIEDQKISTNVRELLKIVSVTLVAASAWYSIKMDIKDYSSENRLDRKLTDVRMNTMELRQTQSENEIREIKKKDEEELKKQLELRNEIIYK